VFPNGSDGGRTLASHLGLDIYAVDVSERTDGRRQPELRGRLRDLRSDGLTDTEIATRLGVSHQRVYQIARGKHH
jgi:DNA invertase Pin-like site-specific DNA recombinase